MCGCSIREIKDPQSGAIIYRSKRLGNTEKFNAIVATYVTPDGVTNTIRIEGYASDQVEGVKAMFSGINDLLVKIAKSTAPIP